MDDWIEQGLIRIRSVGYEHICGLSTDVKLVRRHGTSLSPPDDPIDVGRAPDNPQHQRQGEAAQSDNSRIGSDLNGAIDRVHAIAPSGLFLLRSTAQSIGEKPHPGIVELTEILGPPHGSSVPPWSSISSRPAAQAATWVRAVKPSLPIILLTWDSTVRRLSTSAAAISTFDWPCATSRAISRSRAVSPPAARLAARRSVGSSAGIRACARCVNVFRSGSSAR